MSKMLPNLHVLNSNLALTHTKQLKYTKAHILKLHILQLYSFMTSIMTKQLITMDIH